MKWPRTLVIAAGLFAIATPARAQLEAGVAPYVGARSLDTDLADYRWEVGVDALYGGEAWLRHGRWQAALAVERSSTVQGTGLVGVDSPTVSLTQFAVRARAELFSLGPFATLAGAGIGRLHLGWSPDSQPLAIDGLSEPVTVNYEPVDTTRRELELAARLSLPRGTELFLVGTWSDFDLETAHRAGDEIVLRDDAFSTFDLRLMLSMSLLGPR